MGILQDQVVLITGAGHQRGRSIAQAFARQGAIVAANDLTPINLDETVQQILAAGGQARDYIFDIAKKMPIQALLEQIRDDWGKLDICVHCAQVKPKAALLDMDDWDWQRTLDVNLSSAFLLLQSAGRIMRQQGFGRIVCVINTPQEDFFQGGFSALRASKTGLVGLLLSAAQELGEYGIWTNGIVAGNFGIALRKALPEFTLPSPTPDLGEAVLYACQAPPEGVHGKFLIMEG